MSFGIIQTLNEKQAQAANTVYGSHVVIAGAGTGKTQVLAARIANMLISDAMISAGNILALTFTEAGVVAMRKRLLSVIGVEAYKVAIHTFHSFCNEVIQSNPSYFGINDFEPVTELEQIELTYKLIDGLPNSSPLKRLSGQPYYEAHRLLRFFQMYKDEGWSKEFVFNAVKEYIASLPEREEYKYKRPNKKKGIKAGDVKTGLVQQEEKRMEYILHATELVEKYNASLQKMKRYDFSDMIGWVLNAFQEDENFLLNYQERYQYILVDEFQDTNGTQLELLRKLLNFWDSPNVFVVGDDDQSIYEFNGARIKNVVDFNAEYNPEIVVLTENYRSNQTILDVAKNVIDNNKQRLINTLPGLSKGLTAAINESDKTGKEPAVIVYEYSNPAVEAAITATMIKFHISHGFPASEIAVLYRRHRQGELLLKQLNAYGIPVNIKKRTNVLNTVEVKHLLDIIEYVMYYNESNHGSLEKRFFQILHFDFIEANIEEIHDYYLTKSEETPVPEIIREVQEKLSNLVKAYYNSGIVEFLYQIIDEFGIIEYLLNREDYLSILNHINTFISWVRGESLKRSDLTAADVLAMVSKMKENNLSLNADFLYSKEDGVNMMTIHGAKGLEFEKVFMIGCNRSEWEKARAGSDAYKIPDTITLSTGEDKLESNRRLFYVGLTRAKDNVVVSYSKQTEQGKELEMSQFVSEMGVEVEETPEIDMGNFLFNSISKTRLDLGGINEEIINNRIGEMVMSVSSINSYLHCPVAFYYEKVLRVPTDPQGQLIYGNAVHFALRGLFESYKSNNYLSFDEFFKLFSDSLDKNKGQLLTEEYKRRLALGKRVLKSYYTKVFPMANKVTLNEFHINRVLVGDVPFKGDIDKMEFDGNIFDIVDYKTGSPVNFRHKVSPPSDKNPKGGDYWRQIVTYKIMVDNIPGKEWIFRKGRVDLLTQDGVERYEIPVTVADEEFVKKQINEAYQAILNKEFTEGCGNDRCVWCNFQKDNGLTI